MENYFASNGNGSRINAGNLKGKMNSAPNSAADSNNPGNLMTCQRVNFIFFKVYLFNWLTWFNV